MKHRKNLSFIFAACALLGCDGDENGIDPKGGTPFDQVEVDGVKIYRVKWDNPVVGALYELPSIGYAQTNGFHWEYNKFDLELEVDDADQQHRLYTWPETAGVYGDDESSFFFEGHGMKLDPMTFWDPMSSISTAEGMEDPYNGPELPYKDAAGRSEGRFQLDPSVGLVPLRVVVLHGDGLSVPTFNPPAIPQGWLSEDSARLLFDDMWKGAKSINTNQPYSPDNVLTSWTHHPGAGMVAAGTAGAGRFLQPDRVLDQCDAQFRMVSYHTCEVPPEILYGDGCGALADTGQFNTMRTWVNDHCDVPDDVPRVIFLGSLGAGSCPGGVTKGSQHHGDVAISYLFADKKTLPHELGHLLGLGHVTDSNNLMGPGSTGIALNAEQCPKVNEQAKKQQLKFWPESQFDGEIWNPFEGVEFEQQLAAQEFWGSLNEEQLLAIEEALGSHYESVLYTIWGEPTDWHQGLPALESLIIANFELLSEILDEDQYELLMSLLKG